MKKAILVLAVTGLVALLAAGATLGAGGAKTYKLTAKLGAKQEVPRQVYKNPSGLGGFAATLSEKGTQALLSWRLTFSRLSGPAVAAHVHLGKAGKEGPVAVTLCGPCKSGQHSTVKVSAAVVKAILGGDAYVNVHTAKNPNGEIRGEIGSKLA